MPSDFAKYDFSSRSNAASASISLTPSTACSTGANSLAGSPVTQVDDDQHAVNEFQLNFRLGEGSYGTVYAATHIRSNKKFAVKVLQRSSFFGAEKQIQQEAFIMQGLHHKHVVQFLKLLRTRTHYYFVMDLAEGGELFDLVITHKHFSEGTARKYFQQLMSALAYCHEQGVAHRDLKAENLLLDNKGDLLVCDFGFSTKCLPVPVDDADLDNSQSTDCYMAEGTIHYMSPEALQSSGDHTDIFVQDLWAAGVILYFMLAGTLPFDGRDEEETMYLISSCKVDFDKIASLEARQYLRKILAKDVMERMTLGQMINDPWFLRDLDTSLFPAEDVSDDSSCTAQGGNTSPPSNAGGFRHRNSLHSSMIRTSSLSGDHSGLRRSGSRVFLDFSQSPAEPLSPTEDEEVVIRKAFQAIDTDGYGDHFTFDELRDALILLKKSTVDTTEVTEILHLFTNSDTVTYEQFREAWIHRDIAHIPHRDTQYFQLYQIANLSHTACEKNIVRQLRDAFDSVDEMHTGVIPFQQWKKIFEKTGMTVPDEELRSLLQHWNTTIPDGSISFEDFVAGIVKRDILLRHPLGKKLTMATNLGGFAQLRNVTQSVTEGFLVLGMRDSLASKLATFSERLLLLSTTEHSVPSEAVLTFRYFRDVPHPLTASAFQSSSPPLTITSSCDSCQKKGMHHFHGHCSHHHVVVTSPSLQPLLSPSKHCSVGNAGPASNGTGVCELDIILTPTACVGYTLVKVRRISGLTNDFHESVLHVSSALEREREQANIDCSVVGDSELM